jgi:4-hydroxybenzoate polyprenyltransferase
MVGYLLAIGAAGQNIDWVKLGAVIGAALSLYAAGLIHNDIVDHDEDLKERPHRPIPSGTVSEATAVNLALIFAGAGLALSFAAGLLALTVGSALACLIYAYNRLLKKHSFFGPFSMGGCRAGSVLLGVAAADPCFSCSPPLLAFGWAAVTGLYIAAVTLLARYETAAVRPVLLIPFPARALIVSVGAYLFAARTSVWTATLFFIPIGLALRTTWNLRSHPENPIPPAIGAFIRVLPWLQAAGCLTAGCGPERFWAATAIITGTVIGRPLVRRFYAS